MDRRVPLAVGSAALLSWDRVLRAGASACSSRFAARCRRRFFALAVVDGGGTGFVSTLGAACVFTLGTRCVVAAFVRDRVVLQFSSRGACHGVLYVALESGGLSFVAMVGLFWMACSVNARSCSISLFLSFDVRPLICLAQSEMAAMILSACVMVGLVMFLWVNWMVSVRRSPRVSLIWHR